MKGRSIPSSFFKGNRLKLFKSLSADAVIITANGLLQKSADQAYPFHQDSNFWYLTGLNEPDLILVITKDEEFLIVPKLYVHRQAVIKPLDKNSVSRCSQITEIVNEKEGWQKVRSSLPKNATIATLLPDPTVIRHYGIYANPASRLLYNRLKRSFKAASIVDIRRQVAALRMVKQPVEIGLIQKAIDITSETLSDVLSAKMLSSYSDTGQIEQAILSGFIRRGGSGHAFEPIVAAGRHGALIHYSGLSEPLKDGQLIVCDVGSQYSHYGADITRTLSYGRPSKRQEAVYEAVRHVQSEAYKLIRPGILMKDYEQQVEQLIGEQLRKLGLIKRANHHHRAIRRYYPHACSHSLGIDTHDSADYSKPLPKNMVMTVEPGIYIEEEGIGVRIEDVVILEDEGYRLMSLELPTKLRL